MLSNLISNQNFTTKKALIMPIISFNLKLICILKGTNSVFYNLKFKILIKINFSDFNISIDSQ